MKTNFLEAAPWRLIRTTALLLIAGTAILMMSRDASAQGCGYGGYGGGYGGGGGGGGGYNIGYRGNGISIGIVSGYGGYGGYGRGISVGYSSYRPGPVRYNAAPYGHYPRYQNHYRSGRYDQRRGGHRHH